MQGSVVMLLAVVFLTAASAKLRSRDAFRSVLERLMPRVVVGPLLYAVPIVELVLGGWLLAGYMPHVAAAAALFVLSGFSIVLALMWKRGIEGCACFGETTLTKPAMGLVRNLLLLIGAAWLTWTAPVAPIWATDFGTFVGQVTVVVGFVSLWACLVALSHPRERDNVFILLGWR